jgi:2-iminobutanoate/2-iminopropanoate deaminase
MREIISGPDLPRLGPYSPAVRVGQLIFVSAQAGVDPATGAVPADGGFDAECRQAIANLATVLRAAGADLRDIVRTTVFYTDLANLPTINNVYADVFADEPPARSAALVGLPGGRLIAIDAIAALG